MGWNRNGPGRADRRIVKDTLVGPSMPFVEPTGSHVAIDDREPCSLVAVHRDDALRLGEQKGCHTAAAMLFGDVDLLDLVTDDHHKPGYFIIDHGNHRVTDAVCRARLERLLGTDRDEIVRNIPEMAIAPSVVPDLRNCLCVTMASLAKRHRDMG